jgi:hypothetical protein
MGIIGITLIVLALFWIWALAAGSADTHNKKKRVNDYKDSFKEEINTFHKDKENFRPTMEKSITNQKNVIKNAFQYSLIDWYTKAIEACHQDEFKSKLNKLKKIQSVLKKHIPIKEYHTSRPRSDKKPPNNPAAMFYDDAIEEYKEYGYSKLFSSHLYDIYKERGLGGDLSWQHFSPLECVTILYEKIYLEQHKEHLKIEKKIENELNKIKQNYESWQSEKIKSMEAFVEDCTELTSDALLYFIDDYPLSLNYSNSNKVDPFAFPWHKSNHSLRDKFLGYGGEERNRIDGIRQDWKVDSPYTKNPYLEKQKAFIELEIEEWEKKISNSKKKKLTKRYKKYQR